MAILKPYKVASYRRLCDICGRPRQIEDIRFSENVAICSIHPEFRTAQVLNKINARVRPTKILPVPRPKPLNPVDTWTAEESQIFNFVTKTAPFESATVKTYAPGIVGTHTLPALTWSLAYLTGLLLENRRPATWLTYARKRAIALGEELLVAQVPESNGYPYATGAFLPNRQPNGVSSFLCTATDAGVGIAGLCRLYTITRDERYLRAAKAAAGFVVMLQAYDLAVDFLYVAYGPPVRTYDPDENETDGVYFPGDLVCLWGLSLLKAITGDIVIGPPASSLVKFSSNPSRLISVSIEQMRAFWANGAVGLNGFSAATPFEHFSPKFAVSPIPSEWRGTLITTSDWAAGIYALAEVYGVTDQVADLWTFLSGLRGGGLDTTLAPPTQFTGNTAVGNSYDWASAGLLARATSAKSAPALKNIKDTLSVPRQRYYERTPRSGETLYLGPLGISGPLFQPITDGATARIQSVTRASQVAQIYRQQPQGFTGRGH
jgi:hypothetical protein